MLQQSNVAGHQSWSGKTKDLPERKVPRHHCEHHTERLETNKALRRVGVDKLVSQMLLGILGVVTADPGALLSFLHGCVNRLAHLERHHLREVLLFSFQNLRGAQHHPGSLGETGPPITAKDAEGFLKFLVELRSAKRLESF